MMPGSQHDGQSAPIDRAALAVLAHGDEAVERRLLAVFRKANAADAAALKSALEQRNVEAATSAAHRVMGAGRMAGAVALSAVCERMVRAGQSGDWEAMVAQRDALDRELQRIDAYLDARLGAQPDARP